MMAIWNVLIGLMCIRSCYSFLLQGIHSSTIMTITRSNSLRLPNRQPVRPLCMVKKRSEREKNKKLLIQTGEGDDGDESSITSSEEDDVEAVEEGMLPAIAIIGRPNTGKSTIVNKLADSYQDGGIVHDEPGITRDRSYRTGYWRGYNFQVIDTGGILFDDTKDIFTRHITEQAFIALKEAVCAVFVVDGQEGLHPQDIEIAEWLKKNNRRVPVYVAVNKCESVKVGRAQAEPFEQLGLGVPYPVSGIHGRGLAELLDIMTQEHMDRIQKILPQNYTNIAIVGRPNVGKSSLFNRLYGGNRTIVSDVAGTTRDAIDEIIHRKNSTYRLIDTAGIRRKGKIHFGPEFFMINRAFKAIRRAEVVILMVDATTGIVEQDRILAEHIEQEGRACVIVLNKWDAVKNKDDKTYLRAVENVRGNLPALKWAEIVLISATMGQRTEKLFECIDRAAEQFKRRVPTSVLNEVVNDATLWLAPPTIGSRSGRIYYCSQSGIQPPTMVFFVNDVKLFTDNYKRYIERKIRDSLNFQGAPIQMVWRGKTLRRMDEKVRKGEAKLVGVPGH